MTYILLILMYYDSPFAIQVPMENEKYCNEARNKMIEKGVLFGRSSITCLKVK